MAQIFKYGFKQGTWSFFESGHGKGAADGIGGTLKRIADRIVSCGTDITDVYQFIHFVSKSTKMKLFCITQAEIEAVFKTLPGKIPVLKGTRHLHQLTSEKEGEIRYRDLSCFCAIQRRGFCNCYSPKDFTTSIKQSENIRYNSKFQKSKKKILKVADVYSCSDSSELTDEDSNVSCNSVVRKTIEESTSKNITAGTYLLIHMFGGKKNLSLYKYVGVAQSDMEEDGEIKVMFLRSIDDSGRNFQVKENDVSYVQFDEVLGILKNPSLKMKGNRIYYQFDRLVDVYEK